MSARLDPAVVLEERVFAGGESKRFAELTAAEVAARAQELREVTGWGPTAKVGSVALAWAELARHMDETGAATVGDLEPAEVAERAERMWVVPPGGSLL
jgi:hypothetical protein